ncbi:MAG: glycoside hydrolase family 16 protein [Thermoleophilia bacterium]
MSPHSPSVRALARPLLAALLLAVLAAFGASAARAETAPVGDLDGWRQILVEDFDTPVATGSFPGTVYGSRWAVYRDGGWDTTRRARQAPSRVLSVRDGALAWRFHDDASGTPQIATPLPKLNGPSPYRGIVYGRFAVRFRATALAAGYSVAFLLWPDSDRWPIEGEIDFPAGELTTRQGVGYTYIPAQPTVVRDSFHSTAPFDAWHTAVTEWTPGAVRYYIDGRLIGTSTLNVPSTSMHWVLQTDTTEHGAPPARGAEAGLEVDWAAAWAYSPGTPPAPGVCAACAAPVTPVAPARPALPRKRLAVRPGVCSRRPIAVRRTLTLVFPKGSRKHFARVAGRRVPRVKRVQRLDLRSFAGRTVRIRVAYDTKAGRRLGGCARVRVARI